MATTTYHHSPIGEKYECRGGVIIAHDVIVADKQVDQAEVGTYQDFVPVRVQVGSGAKVHTGTATLRTFAQHQQVVNDRPHKRIRAAATEYIHIHPTCGSQSTYARGMQGRNRVILAAVAVTCTKCLEQPNS